MPARFGATFGHAKRVAPASTFHQVIGCGCSEFPKPAFFGTILITCARNGYIQRHEHDMNQTTSQESELFSAQKVSTELKDVIHGYDDPITHAEIEVKGDVMAMKERHCAHADERARAMRAQHGEASQQGPRMSSLQEAVMNVRAWLTGTDHGVLPAVVLGKRALMNKYDTAIGDTNDLAGLNTILRTQRVDVERAVTSLEARAA